jgi:hypothetical protein
MRRLRRILPFFLTPLGLFAVLALLMGGSRTTYAEEPTPGMGDPPPEAADPDDEDADTPEQLVPRITTAIEKGVKWLKQAQLPDGSWGLIEGDRPYPGQKEGQPYRHPAGATALALYALLKCKEPVDDPVIKKGFKFLKDKYKQPGSAYETSMVLLAVTARADPFKKVKASEVAGEKVRLVGEDRAWAEALQKYLLNKRTKAKMLGWRYNVEAPGLNVQVPQGGNQDLSSTQLATLALLAADRCGIRADSKVWNDIITFSMQQQQDDGPDWERAVYDGAGKLAAKDKKPAPGGSAEKERYGPDKPPAEAPKDKARGFAYIKSDALPPHEGGPTGGMTACGVGNIMMARYILMKRDDPLWSKRDQKLVQRSVYDGLAWLDMNWSPFTNPGGQGAHYHVYYLYCCERAFDLVGNRLLGKHYWYAEMAEQLVNRQDQKGFWDSSSTHKPEKVLDTSFALLFLKRATKGGIPFPSVTGGGDEPPVDNRGK